MSSDRYSDIEDFPDGRTAADYEQDFYRILAAAKAGDPPNEAELTAAPVIQDWSVKRLHDERLEKELGFELWQFRGRFEGHPFLEPEEIGHSSAILQIDPSPLRAWARCTSRIYRLGKPAADRRDVS